MPDLGAAAFIEDGNVEANQADDDADALIAQDDDKSDDGAELGVGQVESEEGTEGGESDGAAEFSDGELSNHDDVPAAAVPPLGPVPVPVPVIVPVPAPVPAGAPRDWTLPNHTDSRRRFDGTCIRWSMYTFSFPLSV